MSTIIILSGPSAVGKTTISDILLERYQDFGRVTTCTSRLPRSNEKNYIFLTKQEFREKIKKNYFIEHSKVYNNYYGILQNEFEKTYKKYKYSLVLVDTVGSLKLIKYCKKNQFHHKSIFLTLKNEAQIKERLLAREKYEDKLTINKKEDIKQRITKIQKELTTAKIFDKKIYNQDLETCVLDIHKFITTDNS